MFHWSRLCRAPNSEKVIMHYLLNWVEYRDEIVHTYWYWQDVPHEVAKWHLRLVKFLPRFKFWKSETIAKGHLSSVEALPSVKFWKSENGLISWTERKILIDFCVNIDITRSSPRDCEISFFLVLGFAELQILKKWKWPYLLNWVEYCDEILHTHWYIDKM